MTIQHVILLTGCLKKQDGDKREGLGGRKMEQNNTVKEVKKSKDRSSIACCSFSGPASSKYSVKYSIALSKSSFGSLRSL